MFIEKGSVDGSCDFVASSTLRRSLRTAFCLLSVFAAALLLARPAFAVDFVVQANGAGGAYTSVNAAIAAAIASAGGPSGKVIEIRANTAGTTQVFAQNIDLSNVNISSTNEANWLTVRVRAGDTIRFRTSGSLLKATGTSRGWKVEGDPAQTDRLQFGDRADFVHTGNDSYETCYPQSMGADIASTVSNYAVRHAQFTGARSYFANVFDGTDFVLEDIAAFDHGTNYYDIHPTKGTQNDWGDLVSVRGLRAKLSNLRGLHGGHNGWGFIARSSVLRDSDFSGYWGDISPAAGARALIVEGVRNVSPYGPILIEGTIIRDSGDSIDETNQALMKTEATHLIMRDNFFWDSDAHLWHMNFTNADDNNAQYFSHYTLYHNTCYISNGTWWNNTFNYNTGSGPDQFEENLIANNLFQQLSDNSKTTSPANIFRYDIGSISLNGWANGLKGTVISGNALGGPSTTNQISVNASGGNSATFGITSVPTGFQGNVYDNVITTVTFDDVGSFRNRTKAGFEVTSWGSGASAGDAPPLTTITASSSGSTITVENARPFFDGWGIRGEVGDYLYIGSSRSVTAGQGVWFGGNPANGSAAIRKDRGAHIPGSSGGGGGGAGTFTFYASDDAYLENGTRYNNGYLKVDPGSTERVSYLKFNVSGLTGTISSVKLRLTCDGDAGNGMVRVRLGDHNNWTETNLSTANAPVSAGQKGTRNITWSTGTTYDITISNAITGDGTYSFFLKMDTGGNDVWFNSDEASVAASLKPQLVIVTQ